MVFGAVQRFSEDIDLAILPAALGFEEGYFNDAPSASQRRKRMDALTQASEAYVQRLQPVLEAEISSVLGASPGGASWLSYEIDSTAGTPNLWFTYPSVTPQTSAYIAKRVKLEFGSLTNQQPSVWSASTILAARRQLSWPVGGGERVKIRYLAVRFSEFLSINGCLASAARQAEGSFRGAVVKA